MGRLSITTFTSVFFTITVINHICISGVLSTTFTIVNKCDQTIWPGILSNSDSAQLSTTGFALRKAESKSFTVPSSWGGRFWGRTHCTQDDSTGKFSCLTGDCGSGKLECAGGGAAPPATLAEFKTNGYGGLDFYDVSLVDGYNLPVMVVPEGGGAGENCNKTGCEVDLNGVCPSELKVSSTDGKESVACKSACEAFREPKYCCSGAYATPDKCSPSSYSQLFKEACPHAYSYAYDDSTSTFTCTAADYIVTFCPSPNTSQKSSQGQGQGQNEETPAGTCEINSTMVYEGALQQDAASPPTCTVTGLVAVAVSIGAALLLLLF